MSALLIAQQAPAASLASNQVAVANGILEGTIETSGVRSFKGIPFAQPPVGPLRWQPPQPPKSWSGVRPAQKFGPRPMQRPIYSDMIFRSGAVSEDCLYINVWSPAKSANQRLPVMVYFFGGGFMAGDGSEGRYDGESMAQRGIVSVTVNYRLGVFGFMAHPELTQESPHHASGNYGLLDQNAALKWVQENIAAFGGDPAQVTIAGESAGSISVSAQMASPLSKGLFARAIGESGSLLGAMPPVPLADAEQAGLKFATNCGAASLAALRALSADKILEAANMAGSPRFGLAVDGYFLAENPFAVFAAGKQAKVPLLVGWNSEESGFRSVISSGGPSLTNFEAAVRRLYRDRADEVLKVYHPTNDSEVLAAATDLASDRFIAFSTWKWADAHCQSGSQPVYRYYYARPRPTARGGAVHSAEIEYCLGNLRFNKVYAWTADDQKVSDTMQSYFANFIKTGNPNGPSLLNWPAMKPGQPAQYLRLDVQPRLETEPHRDRYLFLDTVQPGNPQARTSGR
jgi:para-nitrobenzyl esterase